MTEIHPFEGPEDSTDIDIRVRSAFQPLTNTLQIFGVYIPRYRKGTSRIVQLIYGVFVAALLLANTIRIGLLLKSTTVLPENLITSTSLFVIRSCQAYLATATLIVTSRKLDPLLDTIISYHNKYGFAYNISQLSKAILLFCITAVLTSIAGSVVYLCILSLPGTEMKSFLSPFDALTDMGLTTGIIVLGVITLYGYSIVTLTIVMFGVFCHCLNKEFEALNRRVRETSNTEKPDYEDLRLQHSENCKVLAEANLIVTHTLFTVLVIAIPLPCLVLYGIITGSLQRFDLMFLLCNVFTMISISFAIIISAALLNIKAHGCLDDLTCCRLKHLPEKTIQIVNIFISRLTGPPIGFHVYGLFTIDTSTILTIFGMLLTYGVMVLQFKPEEKVFPVSSSISNVSLIP